MATVVIEDDEIWRSRMGDVVPLHGRRGRSAEDAELDAFAARDMELPIIDAPAAPTRTMGLISAADCLRDLRERMQPSPRYSTPWPSLTTALGLGGWFAGEVYTLVGGTGAGKTSFALAVARHHALEHGPVIYVSEEMTPGHCLARSSASLLAVPSNAIIRGDIDATDQQLMCGIPARMFLMRRQGLDKIRAAAMHLRDEYGSGPLIVVDYIGKLAAAAMAAMERPDPRLAMTQVSSALCAMAEELGSPMLGLSAGSRASTGKLRGNRNGKRGSVRDLPPSELVDTAKESGDVEYDAAGLLTLSVSDEPTCSGGLVATLTVAKARYGALQHIAMEFFGERGEWVDHGRVEQTSAEDRREADVTGLRDAIAGALRSGGPASATTLAKALRRRREDVMTAVTEMAACGLVESCGAGSRTRIKLKEDS